MLGTVVGFVIARSAGTTQKPALCKTVLREYTGKPLKEFHPKSGKG